MSIVRKEKFIFVESNANHNKFWYIEEHDSGMIRTVWGRVGNKESSSEKQFGSKASKEYDKLVKSKLNKGYTQLKTIDSEISSLNTQSLNNMTLKSLALDEIEFDKSNKVISDMIKRFCDANIHNITENTSITWNSTSNVFQTPCGIITAVAITDARALLDDIAEKFNKYEFDNEFVKFTEQYCTIIPQKVHGKFEARKIFADKHDIAKQYDILDSLEDSLKLIEALNKKNAGKKSAAEKLFNTSIIEVNDKKVIDRIIHIFNATKQSIHSCRNLKIKRVFEIKIDKMYNEFQETKTKWSNKQKDYNQLELWHGTQKSNIISILKNGFIIPPSNAKHCTGRMFGSSGLYLSDQSTKALNYSYGWWSGNRNKNCFMFLCDAMCGKQYIPSGSCSNLPKGYDSIFAKAGRSGVQNNEMIVPLKQVNPKYLIEFDE
jgi:predicted DNA-binding WGR domain protein